MPFHFGSSLNMYPYSFQKRSYISERTSFFTFATLFQGKKLVSEQVPFLKEFVALNFYTHKNF